MVVSMKRCYRRMSSAHWRAKARATNLERLARLVVVDDKALVALGVLLAVLELAIDFDLVALYIKVRNHDVYESKH